MGDDAAHVHVLGVERHSLLQRKLGVLLTWKVPEVIPTVGPFVPTAFESFDLKRQRLVDACVEQLLNLSDEQINDLLWKQDSAKLNLHSWSKFLTDEIHMLSYRIPDWYIGGFGHPEHVADFDYWTKMPVFDVGELTCLSIGINPTEFSIRKLLDFVSSKDRAKFCTPLDFLVRRFEQLDRRFGNHGPQTRVYPKDFIQWARQFEFAVHPGFLEPLARYHPSKLPTADATSPRKQDQREVDKIAQLFTAMAIDQLGYVPGNPRSPIPKEITDLALSMGMTISDDTVRKYLRLGAKFISSDWKSKER